MRKNAVKYKIDPYIIAAIVWTESAGDPWAIRFEPAWSRYLSARDFAENVGSTLETEEISQATSWGYMQIMGTTARSLGFKGFLPGLCRPGVNINYGTKFLKEVWEKYDGPENAIASYNAGKPRLTPGGMFKNQTYVDKVMGKYRVLRELQYLK